MIKTLVMENFLPFRGRVELPLADQGVVLVRGDVRVSAATDSNGAGKTSVAHAISYGLFGEDLAGRKADAVACRFTEGQCVVRLDMEDALGEWSVLRTRRPASLMTVGIPGENGDAASVQEKVEQRLGFGLRTFKNAVVFGQGAFDRFAGAGQEEQMRMLDEIQGVDFRESLERAKVWRGQLQEELRKASEGRRASASRRDAVGSALAVQRSARDSFDAEKGRQVEAGVAARASAQSRLDDVLADIALAERERSDLAAMLGARERLRAVEVECSGLVEALRDAEADARECAAKLGDLEGRLSALVEEGSCPTCRQPVASRKAAIRKLFAPEIKELTRCAGVADKRVVSATARLSLASTERANLLSAFTALVPTGADPQRHVALLELRTGHREVARRADAKAAAEGDLQGAAARLSETKARVWDGQGALDASERDLERLAVADSIAAAREERLTAAVSLAEYCVEAFGDRGIRSMLVDGVADFVNERVAAHLEVLAGGEATMRMSALTALKKGGARERISFTPEWAWGGSGPDAGSGGQDRRMDLAVFAAVQDLAESRGARPFPIKVYDEVFDALDGRGKELAAEWIRRAARERGTVLVVTHSKEMEAVVEPDRTWTVVMEKDGARVEVS
jgi:hypothetical protein